jgi:hypothetical protein
MNKMIFLEVERDDKFARFWFDLTLPLGEINDKSMANLVAAFSFRKLQSTGPRHWSKAYSVANGPLIDYQPADDESSYPVQAAGLLTPLAFLVPAPLQHQNPAMMKSGRLR